MNFSWKLPRKFLLRILRIEKNWIHCFSTNGATDLRWEFSRRKKIYANIFCFQPQFFASLLGNCKRCWGSRPKNNNFPIKTENHFGLNDYQKSSRFLGILVDYILVHISHKSSGLSIWKETKGKVLPWDPNLVANNVERMNNWSLISQHKKYWLYSIKLDMALYEIRETKLRAASFTFDNANFPVQIGFF